MTDDDDILLPEPPANLHKQDFLDRQEISDHTQLQAESNLSLQLDFATIPVSKEEFSSLGLSSLETAMLQAELSDSQMYLKNIHKGFKFARSTQSLINLVGAGLAVHRQRRQTLKELKESKQGPLEFDAHGNLIKN